MKKRIIILPIIIILTLSSCLATAPGPQPTTQPTPVTEFPPLVLSASPEQGAEVQVDIPITLAFDQAMDQETVEDGFALQPEISGTLDWTDDRTVSFKPTDAYQAGQRYKLTLAETARSADGVSLNRPFELAFNTIGPLEVTNVQPENEATEILPYTPITVLFNRPVVPLGAIEDLDSLPDPLTFVPPVRGEGEWLNTGIYQFTPDDGFVPATLYTARIAAGLSDVSGSELADDFVWTFSTATPKVVATYPNAGSIYVTTTPVISVAFNQVMNRESVEGALLLVDKDGDSIIAGTFSWVDEGLVEPRDPDDFYYGGFEDDDGPVVVGVETVMFAPAEPLDMDTVYEIIIADSAQALSGNRSNMADIYVSSFTTVAPFVIERTYPNDGDTQVTYYQDLEVTFSAPVNPASIKIGENVLISPEIDVTEVYSYFWGNDTTFSLNLPDEASSSYTVTLLDTIESRYGEPLGADTTVTWDTSAFSPALFLHRPGFEGISTFSAYTPTLAFVTTRNVGQVNFSLYDLPESDFVRLNGDNRWQAKRNYVANPDDLIRTWSIATNGLLNQSVLYGTNLAEDEDDVLAPGLYYLEVWLDPGDIYPEAQDIGIPDPVQQILVVSNHNLTFKTTATESMAWLTDLATGEPIAEVPVRFRSERSSLATGVTDADGVTLKTHRPLDAWQARFAISDEPFALTMNSWQEGVERWQYGLSTEDFLRPYNGQLYTDRAIYRPGQTVYFKGIIRQDDDARYMLPPNDESVLLQVYDAQGKEIFAGDYFLNENGTLNGELTLDEEASLGFYSIQFEYQDEFFSGSFQVAEFRKPEFLIEVATDQPEYGNGDEIQTTAQANFFFGGALANAPVRYSVLSADSFFNYTGPAGRYDFTDFDSSRRGDTYFGSFGELITEGEGVTDGDGRFVLDVPADISDRTTSQNFTLEVSVTDPDSNQVVSGRTSSIVHKGDYYIGVRPRQYVGSTGDDALIDLITVDWQSQPAPDQDLTVVLAERNWYSVQVQAEDGRYYWESQVETIPVQTQTVTTDDDGKGTVAFVPENGGIYQVIATGMDADGNEIRSSTFMWVSGSQFVNWRQENNDRLELVADKQEYNVGDIATVLIPHPYVGPVTALVTQERGHIYSHDVMTLASNSEQLKIPITADMLPNVFVSVVIIKEPDEANPIASFKVGYAQLPINVREKEINIALTADKPADELYRPGESVTYDVLAVDSDGQPVEAEFSLALVDKAILTLADETTSSLLDQFWRERGLGVGTATGLAISADRVNLSVAPEAKGGGGGGFDEAFSVIRGDFKDTAFWMADFTTDADGRGSVTTTLPDNLTTWVLTAKGISRDTLVGDEQVEIVSTKPVLVRPVAPRFLVVGDEAQLSMIVQNNSREDVVLDTFFEGVGVSVMDGDAVSEVEIKAGGKTTLDYPVKALTASEAILRFGAKGSDFEDAVEITIPIHRHSTPETVGTAGVLDQDGQRLEGIALPARFDETQGQLTVKIDPSLASGMRAGLDYLEHFPYECTEQTVSRFLPNVVTYRAYQALNLDNPDLAARLPGLVSLGLQRLYNQQRLDGGWGWWSLSESNPFLTAYVVLGLVEAERAGFAIEDQVLFDGLSFLESSLRKPSDVREGWHANRQAFMLYAMAEANAGDMSRTVLLFNQREKLDIYGRAYLAMAFHLMEPDDQRITTLLSDITGEAIVSATGAHWEEANPDFYNMNTDTRSTAIVIAALSRLDPDNALAPNAVRWLMSVRENGYWETTQESAWAVIGLTDWMVETGELDGNYDWDVALNGDGLGAGQVNADNIDLDTTLTVAVADLLADEVNRLVIGRAPQGTADESLGRLYYTAHLEYYKPVAEVKALNRGVIVARQYTLADAETDDQPASAISGANVGDIITVKLTIVAPNDLHYVKVEDPIPAGTEAIDNSLNTTSIVDDGPQITRQRGRGWGWWWFNHTEVRDEKAVLFADFLPKGTYEYTYQIRATLPGEYRVLPTHAEEMYFPEVFGRGDGGVFTVVE
ncbi:MAG: Ig-like domain-containing protein [Chloroflexota bacterium]